MAADGIQADDRSKLLTGLLLLSLLLAIVIGSFVMPVHRWADSSTYFMQIQSIAGDQDIQYEEKDILRTLESNFDDAPAGLFLIKTEDSRYIYGKDYSYALFAAPFYAGLGLHGLLLFNGLMFFGMIVMGYLYLRKKNTRFVSLFVSTLFFFLSTAIFYVSWVHIEIYNMFLITLGLFLWQAYMENRSVRHLAAASFIFGLAVVAKMPIAIFFFPFAIYELYSRRWKHFLIMACCLAVPLVIFYGYFYLNAGVLSYYGGNRLFYTSNFPFVGGYDTVNEAGAHYFSLNGDTTVLINDENVLMIPYNAVYYLIGKFTGLVWYYPLAVFAVAAFALSRASGKSGGVKGAVGLCVVAGIGLYMLEFITILGNNYPGGSHAIGNRYFIIYPAFLFLLGKVDWKKYTIFLLLPLITLTPMMMHPVGTSLAPDAHTFNFPYTWLPLENSQVNNLPLYTNSLYMDRLNMFSLSAPPDSELGNDAVFIRDTDLYVWSRSPLDHLDLGLVALYDNSSVRLVSGDNVTSVDIRKDECVSVALKSPAAEYADGNIYLYHWDVIADSPLWITKLKDTERSPGDIILMRNWYLPEQWDGARTRWISDNASFLTYADSEGSYDISFAASSFMHPRTLRLTVNGVEAYNETISGLAQTGNISMMQVNGEVILKPGYNVITISSVEGTDSSAHMPVPHSDDVRDLSFAIQNLTVRSSY